MPAIILCPSCGKKLKVPDNFQHTRARCPGCGEMVALRREPGADAAPTPRRESEPPDDRFAFQQEAAPSEKKNVRRPTEYEDEERPRQRPARTEEGRRRPPPEDDASAEEDRPHKKRRKKRRRASSGEGVPEWVWWGGALCAYATVLFLIAAAVAAAGHKELVFLYGIAMAVMVPVSTVILIASMFVTSLIAGGIDFGEIHVVIPKLFLLLLIVNTVFLLPVDNQFVEILLLVFLPVVWLVCLMAFFGLDFWEASMLSFVNWALNFVLKWALVAAVLGALTRGGPAPDHPGGPLRPDAPASQEEKDLDRLDELGGEFVEDEN